MGLGLAYDNTVPKSTVLAASSQRDSTRNTTVKWYPEPSLVGVALVWGYGLAYFGSPLLTKLL